MSPLGRVANVIIEPQRTFADIAARPGWWLPMILLTAVSVMYTVALSQRVGWERVFRQAMESNSKMQDMPPEQREQALQMQVKITAVTAPIGAVLAVPVMMLATAGILLFIFGTLLGGTVNFKQSLGVVAHAWIPSLFFTLASLLVMFMKDPSDFDMRNPAGFNVGFYLDPHSVPAWLVSLGNSIDLFSFWTILMLATGMAVASKKSWLASLFGVATPWLLYVIAKVAWTAFFG